MSDDIGMSKRDMEKLLVMQSKELGKLVGANADLLAENDALKSKLAMAVEALEMVESENGCSYCMHCAPCGSMFGLVQERAREVLEKIKCGE